MDTHQVINYLSELSGIPSAALYRRIPITEGLTADQRLFNKLLDEKDDIINRYKTSADERPKKSPSPTSTSSIQNFIPLIGKKNGMINLRKEYKNPTIIAKIDDFEQQGFKHFRSIRGDGNCFYRSVATGLIECMIKNEQLYEHISAVLQHQREGLDEETYGHLLDFLKVVDGLHRQQHQEQIEDTSHATPDAAEFNHSSNEVLTEERVSNALPSSGKSVNSFQVPDSRESGEEESLVGSQCDEDSMVIVDESEDESAPLIPKQEGDNHNEPHSAAHADRAQAFQSHEALSAHPLASSINEWMLSSTDLRTIAHDIPSADDTQCASPQLAREAEDPPNQISLEDQTDRHATPDTAPTADRIVTQDILELGSGEYESSPSKNKEEPKLEPAVPVARVDVEALSEQYATDLELSQWFVKAFRQLSAFALQRDPVFAYYLSEGQTIDSLREVALKMGEDAEQLQMIALFSILKIGCQAFQLDRGNNNASYTLPDESAVPLIYLLFRPGHYDLLYKA